MRERNADTRLRWTVIVLLHKQNNVPEYYRTMMAGTNMEKEVLSIPL